MSLVLLVDTDARELARCMRVLAPEAATGVIGTVDLVVAKQLLATETFGLVLIAVRHQAELAAELTPAQGTAVVLGVERAINLAAQDFPSGGVAYPLPWSDELLLTQLRRVTHARRSLPISFTPIDVIQMTGTAKESRSLTIMRDGKEVGTIEMRAGEVWSASDAEGEGEDAFRRLLRPEMRARVRAPKDAPAQNIHRPLMTLLLDALRANDESDRHGSERTPTQPPASAEVDLRALHAEASQLLLARKYTEAARRFEALVQLDPSPVVKANLEQLRKLGYLE